MSFKASDHSSFVLFVLAALAALGVDAPAETAARHHQQGVEHHLRRALDDASREYARALALDPPRDPTADELRVVHRFAPRLHTTPTEPFPLKDAAAVMHPAERLIAYHLFWDDDIDFPEDNDPCDHEVVWVQYSADRQTLERVWTYFHGRILAGGEAAMTDARAHAMRPRVNVQWGKHGSMPAGWEQMSITIQPGDDERPGASANQSVTLAQYNDDTFSRLSRAGRRLPDHPLARRLGWPDRFTGTSRDFADFSRVVDLPALLARTRMVKVSQWNSATINQHFLTYNFRPKTEWPVAVAVVQPAPAAPPG